MIAFLVCCHSAMDYQRLAVIFLACTFSLPEVMGELEISIKQGKLRGFYGTTFSGRKFISFLSVPFARAPVGELRFKEPKPPKSWVGTYMANQLPAACLQYDYATYKTRFAIHGDEDCLYLNIFTPKLPNTNATEDSKLNVIVYIHGGAFTFSSNSQYGPDFLLDKDLVFVTLNYRLGALGFLNTEDDVIPGNLGLKDQVMALKWVKENIAAFSGDPNKVTIAGMSAGGASVHYHMMSPLSKGLFSKAISMSGVALCPWSQTENSREKSFKVAKELGCPVNDTELMLKCLQQRPASHIVSLIKLFLPWLLLPFSPFGPVIERKSPNAFIDRPPIDIINQGDLHDVPWLISVNSNEGLYPGAEIVCNSKNMKTLKKNWQSIAPILLDYQYTAPRNVKTINDKVWKKYMTKNALSCNATIEMLGERLFVADTVRTGILQSSRMSSPVYAYMFSYRGNQSLSDRFCSLKNYGTSHGDDLGYVIKTRYLDPTLQESDIQMAKMMVDLWESFVLTGKPKFGDSVVEWFPLEANSPSFSMLQIQSPEVAKFTRLHAPTMGNSLFWSSLGLMENVPTVRLVNDEL